MHPEIISWPNRYFYEGRLRSPEELLESRMSPLAPYCVLRTQFLQDSDRYAIRLTKSRLTSENLREGVSGNDSSYHFIPTFESANSCGVNVGQNS